MDSVPTSTNPKTELTDKLKGANNILVTVSRNPSVDQLSACIGLTLLLNKLGKHAAAVFSGSVPSTLEFLKPEDTLEKNTDSLRDFIIALDKAKADKLRYKVEDNVVRIFITPYKTSISQEDLEFSQGDFNVDVVVALGVQKQEDLDEAITAHGRILHDATVSSVNISNEGGLGSINWNDAQASSLSELVTELAQNLGGDLLDNQIATALLTGIVAETARFSNEKTSSQTMSVSAALMAAGANQQLVATQLQEPATNNDSNSDSNSDNNDQSDNNSDDPAKPNDNPPKSDDGSLEINHDDNSSDQTFELPAPEEPAADQPALPELPNVPNDLPVIDANEQLDHLSAGPKMVTEPPSLGGMLTANSQPEDMDDSSDPLSLPNIEAHEELLNHSNTPPAPEPIPASAPAPAPSLAPQPLITGLTPPPPAWVPPASDPLNSSDQPQPEHTLSELESSLGSPHVAAAGEEPPAGLDAARDEVSRALNDTDNSSPVTQPPIQALNAQPFGDQLHPAPATPTDTDPLLAIDYDAKPPQADQPPAGSPSDPSKDLAAILQNDVPTLPTPPDDAATPATDPLTTAPQVTDPTAPPPVPPPMPFQFGGTPDGGQPSAQ